MITMCSNGQPVAGSQLTVVCRRAVPKDCGSFPSAKVVSSGELQRLVGYANDEKIQAHQKVKAEDEGQQILQKSIEQIICNSIKSCQLTHPNSFNEEIASI